MTQERVDIPIGIDLASLNKGIDSMVGLLDDGFGDVAASTGRFQTRLGTLANQVDSFNSASSLTIPDLSSTWTATSDQIGHAVGQVGFFNSTVKDSTVGAAIDKASSKFRILRNDVSQTRMEYDRLSSTSASVVVRKPEAATGTVSKMAAVGSVVQLGAVGAQVSAMSKISGSLNSVQSKVRNTQATFDNFRLAKLAPPVNEDMNVVGNVVDKVGDKAATRRRNQSTRSAKHLMRASVAGKARPNRSQRHPERSATSSTSRL